MKLKNILLFILITSSCKKESIKSDCGDNTIKVNINNSSYCVISTHLRPYNRNNQFGFQCFPEGGAIEVNFKQITGTGSFSADWFNYFDYKEKVWFKANKENIEQIKVKITKYDTNFLSGYTDKVNLIHENDPNRKLIVSLAFEKLKVN